MPGEDSALHFAVLQQFWSHLLFATPQIHPAFFFFPSLKGVPAALWAPGRATGWGYGSVQQGKSLPAPCPVGNQRVQPGSLRNHRPGSHQRALLGKTGRDWALKCCSALSYLGECVEDLAGLPQGLCYQDLVSVDLQGNKV